jgi:alkane 1-monooxygenase
MQQAWKVIKKYTYLIVFIVPAALMIGAHFGGGLAFLTPLVAFGLLPLLDLIIGEDQSNYSEAEEKQMDGELYYRLITFLFVPAYYLALGYALYRAVTADWSLFDYIGNVWSAGILGGINITVAHELGHKQNRFEKFLAKTLLHGVFYGHFMNEHNKGHHAMVSTPEDPATSRFGESFYAFYPRTVIGTFNKACELEAQRLERMQKSPWNWRNEMYRNVSYPLLMTLAIYFGANALFSEPTALFGLSAGATAAGFFVLHAVMGFTLLEVVNYLEHYGLERRKLDNGRYERVAPVHSWNSNHLVTNCFLYHLQRHSDHHTWPARRYQTLRNFSDSPQLPTGYAGMVLLAAVPPLWFAVMNPRVESFMRRQGANHHIDQHNAIA